MIHNASWHTLTANRFDLGGYRVGPELSTSLVNTSDFNESNVVCSESFNEKLLRSQVAVSWR